ncbi:MAG TPA: MBL fold metallo-hydrolase [Xanthomonadales bacterium]|nr:MBL fold metallo-hydrolase [Xanthomonadales bacterium]
MRLRNRVIGELLLLWVLSSGLQADVTITKLANAGVIIADGETRVMIDGMVVEPYSVYGSLPPEAIPSFNQALAEFAGIDMALVSHRHHEHNQPEFACGFMQASRSTVLYTSGQVIGLMREKCRQFMTTSPRVHEIDPQYGAPRVIEAPGLKVTVFPLSHGTRKDARIQNFGHLVEMGGTSVLHVGDAAMNPEDFERAGLGQRKVDVALIPFLYFQPGPGAELVRRYLDATLKIAVHIPPSEVEEVKAYMAESYPRVIVFERPLDRIRFSANLDPSP